MQAVRYHPSGRPRPCRLQNLLHRIPTSPMLLLQPPLNTRTRQGGRRGIATMARSDQKATEERGKSPVVAGAFVWMDQRVLPVPTICVRRSKGTDHHEFAKSQVTLSQDKLPGEKPYDLWQNGPLQIAPLIVITSPTPVE